jgi:hypothetical protein
VVQRVAAMIGLKRGIIEFWFLEGVAANTLLELFSGL